MKTMTAMTRHERRARRLRGFVTAKDARLAARLARLDYKVCSESGALKVPSKMRNWHLSNSLERTGATYVVGIYNIGFPEPVIHHRWRRLVAEQVTANKDG